MADIGTNPYLELLQQRDRPRGNPWDLLSNALLGLGSGISQAGASGAGWGAGIAPGLMLGNQMTAQAEHQAEQERMRRLQIGLQAQEWDEKRKQREQQAAAMAGLGNLLTGTGTDQGTPGITAPQGPQVAMGPGGDYNQRTRGLESRGGQMIFNELGSGAFGPYQFMPGTWADVRAKNPNLNLPEDMTKATREQHDVAHEAFKAGNAAILQGAGFQPTPENLYLAHRFGAGGALSVLRSDPTKSLAEVLPADWQRQNPDMRGQTAGGFRRLATERMGGVGVPYQVPPDAKPTQYAMIPPQGGGEGDAKPGGDLSGWTMPVMPQPQWPAPAQQPPQVAQGGPTPINPNTPAPQFMQPQPPTPGGPAVPPPVTQGPGGRPPLEPPTVRPPSPAQLSPEARQRLKILTSLPDMTPVQFASEMSKEIAAERQQRQEQANKQWDRQWSEYAHSRGLTEEQAKEQRKMETELVDVQVRGSNEVKSVTKAEALAGAKSGAFVPLKAGEVARAEAAAKLAADNAGRAAANQDVIFNTTTGQWEPNTTAIQAKKDISAAQGTDPSSKITLELAQDAIKRNSDIQKAGAAAGGTLRNINIFNKLSEDVTTGKFTGSTIDLKAALKGAGINLEAWGIPDKLGPAQAMQMMSQRFALEMRQEMPGPMSDGDRAFMERGALSIEKDPGANKIMAAWLKGNAERAQDRAKFAREYIRSADFKTDPAGLDDYVEQKLAGKDYFDHSVLPKDTQPGESPVDAELRRRGKMNSANPPPGR